MWYNTQVTANGGIAQLARAFGSYPTGRWFKSDFRYHSFNRKSKEKNMGTRPGGQAVKTPPFHGGNTSSILVRVTIFFLFFCPFFSVLFRGVAQLVSRLLWEREQVTPFLKIKSAKKPCNTGIFGTLQNLKKA